VVAGASVCKATIIIEVSSIKGKAAFVKDPRQKMKVLENDGEVSAGRNDGEMPLRSLRKRSG